jgi:hypothetical protein
MKTTPFLALGGRSLSEAPPLYEPHFSTSRVPTVKSKTMGWKIAAAAAALQAFGASAQVIVTNPTQPYTQNFDVAALRVPDGQDNVRWTDNSTVPGWYLTGDYTLTTAMGGTTAGNHNYGVSGSSDRAIGFRLWDSSYSIGLGLTNNTGKTIKAIDISYRGEQYQVTTFSAGSIGVFYKIGGTYSGLTTFGRPGWTRVPELTWTTPKSSAPVPATLNGNADGNFIVKTGRVDLTWNNGETLWLGWHYTNTSWTVHAFGLDDVSVSFVVPAKKGMAIRIR